jgi:hypothetical protein
MKATWLFRVAAVVFVLFAAGHTLGFLTFRAPTPEGRAVYDAMNQVHFTVGNTDYSYGDFYRGFGLSCSMAMLFSAFLSGTWVHGHAKRHKQSVRWVGCFSPCRWPACSSV